MAFILSDRVQETTTTTGTGSVTLLGPVTGFQSFAAIGNGNTTYYAIAGQNTSEWEVGIGTYTSGGTTLSRSTILASSNSGGLVNFSAGTKDVFVTQPAERAVYVDSANSTVNVPQLSATSITDSGNLTFTGTGNRITGDFSNATIASRVMFQTSSANTTTAISAIPNGTGVASQYAAYSNSDPTNASVGIFANNNATVNLQSSITGTGTYLPMTFLTSGTEKLRIAADTTGTYTFGGTAPRITGDFSNATVASRVMFQSSTVNGYTAVAVIPNGTSTQSFIGAANGSDPNNTSFMQIDCGPSAAFVRSTITGTGTHLPMVFQTGGSERMRIDTSGNVGVGTSSPSAKLDVYTAATVVEARIRNDNGFLQFQTDTDGVNRLVSLNAAASASAAFAFNGSGGAERMRIDSSGNVGIGLVPTANTTSKLQVAGDITRYGGSGGFLFNVYYSIANNRWEYASNAPAAGWVDAGTGNTAFLSTGNVSGAAGTAAAMNERMRIDSSGNVSIGTTSTSGYKFAINSGGKTQYFTTDATSSYYYTDGNFYFGATSTYNVVAVTNNIERMRIDASGNVGIGTSSPNGKLVSVGASGTNQFVAGTSSGGGVFINAYDSSTLYHLAYTAGATPITGYAIGSQSNIPLSFFVNNAEKARIDTSGNLLVGTTDASRTASVGARLGFAGSATAGTISSTKASSVNTDDTFQVYSTGAGAYRFYVDMGGTIHATSTSIAAISDSTLKTNVKDLETGLAEVLALKPRRFDWINGDATNVAGFIAQEVEQVLPELVIESKYSADKEGNDIFKKNLKMGDILPTLVKAIQEQQAIIQQLQADVSALKGN